MILSASSPALAEYTENEKKLAAEVKRLRQKVEKLEEELQLWKEKTRLLEDKNSIQEELNNKLQVMLEEERAQHTDEIKLYKRKINLLEDQKADWKKQAKANNGLKWSERGQWAFYGASAVAILQVIAGNL